MFSVKNVRLSSAPLSSLFFHSADLSFLTPSPYLFPHTRLLQFGKDVPSPSDSLTDDNEGFFRLSFSSATPEQMKKAAQILKKTTAEFFRA